MKIIFYELFFLIVMNRNVDEVSSMSFVPFYKEKGFKEKKNLIK